MISARKAKQLGVTTKLTCSHVNTPLGQSERAYYLSYFIVLDVKCCVLLHILLHVVACCLEMLRLKPVTQRLFSCKRTQQLPTLLRPQCCELLRPFARSLTEVELHLRYRLGSVDGALLGERSFGLIKCTFAAICLYNFYAKYFKANLMDCRWMKFFVKTFLPTAGILDIEVSAIIQLNVTALAVYNTKICRC